MWDALCKHTAVKRMARCVYVAAETCATSSCRNVHYQFPPKRTLPVPAKTYATSSRRNIRYQFPPKHALPVPAETYTTSSRRNLCCVFVSNLEIHWKFKLCMPNMYIHPFFCLLFILPLLAHHTSVKLLQNSRQRNLEGVWPLWGVYVACDKVELCDGVLTCLA